ncbi:MAG: glutathione S-transferase [Methylococcaceae bacterium]|jgi:glutathione S-transferase
MKCTTLKLASHNGKTPPSLSVAINSKPVLYSFRRCPYAMRARLALATASLVVEFREIELRNKPQALLAISAKATVPVLQLSDRLVLDESLDIMLWALAQNDPGVWLDSRWLDDAQHLIQSNDGDFKFYLDRYKYAERYPEHPKVYYRQQASLFLSDLEQRLNAKRYLCADTFTVADAAIAPFIRQFANVDRVWFETTYVALNNWLGQFLASQAFHNIMAKHPPWQPNDQPLFLKMNSMASPQHIAH